MRTVLRFFLAAAVLVAVGGGSARIASSANESEPSFDCGKKNVTIWFLPKGGSSTVQVVGGLSSTWPVPFGRGIAYADLPASPGVSYGAACLPKKSLGPLTSVAKTTVSTASRLWCSLPRSPLMDTVGLSNGTNRLRMVLPPGQLIVSADLRPKGASTLRYSTKYCKRTPAK